MGLKRFVAETFVKRWLKGAEQGKEGTGVKKAIDYFRKHKREATAILAAITAGLMAMGPEYQSAVNVVSYITVFLGGAGFVDSDAAHKAK